MRTIPQLIEEMSFEELEATKILIQGEIKHRLKIKEVKNEKLLFG